MRPRKTLKGGGQAVGCRLFLKIVTPSKGGRLVVLSLASWASLPSLASLASFFRLVGLIGLLKGLMRAYRGLCGFLRPLRPYKALPGIIKRHKVLKGLITVEIARCVRPLWTSCYFRRLFCFARLHMVL